MMSSNLFTRFPPHQRKLFCSSSTYLHLVRSARDLRHGRANKISKSTISNQCKKFFVITFVGSICWIAAYSYLMVWWANVAGETAGIPPEKIVHKPLFLPGLV
uniref:(California timema) hypothetical protein n=1 Tax=Timema californicum TaxID=61474 RepID=A0A7R9PC50_TIMCA|nr:unnamed protein product [Timema californicum]